MFTLYTSLVRVAPLMPPPPPPHCVNRYYHRRRPAQVTQITWTWLQIDWLRKNICSFVVVAAAALACQCAAGVFGLQSHWTPSMEATGHRIISANQFVRLMQAVVIAVRLYSYNRSKQITFSSTRCVLQLFFCNRIRNKLSMGLKHVICSERRWVSMVAEN